MTVRIEKENDGIAVIVLDDPKVRNALTADARIELRDVLEVLHTDRHVHAVVITGAGGNFCAGGDVRTMGETDIAKIDSRMNDVAHTAELFAAFPKPVIAAVAGHAAGAGVSLACLADIVVAEKTAKFTFSHLKMALAPDWGLSVTLGWRVGATQAKRLVLTRGTIDGTEALRMRLADIVVAEGQARTRAVKEAQALAGGPPEAIASIKTIMSGLDELRGALATEAAEQRKRFPHAEHQEAAAAFREKRTPDFTKR